MAVVSGGLGQPESGAIVAGGLGASGDRGGPTYVNFTVTSFPEAQQLLDEFGDPLLDDFGNPLFDDGGVTTRITAVSTTRLALGVTSTASSSITAEVLGDEVTPPSTSGAGARITPRRILPEPRRRTTFVDVRLSVHCKSSAVITADVTVNFDAELEELLLVGAL